MRDDTPGPLTAQERELLHSLLGNDFVGVEALREQAQAVLAKQGCKCGCGTIDFVVTGEGVPRSEAPSPAPAEGRVRDVGGEDIGGLLLFVADGMLSSLEIYSFGDPLPLPNVEQVQWVRVPR